MTAKADLFTSRAEEADRHEADAQRPALGSSYSHILTATSAGSEAHRQIRSANRQSREDKAAEDAYRARKCEVVMWPDGSLVQIQGLPGWEQFEEDGGTKEAVSTFSWKSRRELVRKLDTLHRAARPVFVTLTLPRELEAKPTEAKEWLRVWLQRRCRHAPSMSAIWKMEPQEDGTPHFHLFLFGITFIPWQLVATSWAETVTGTKCMEHPPIVRGEEQGDIFREWLARMVEEGKVTPLFAKVASAATKVEAIRTRNGILSYAAKYLAKLPEGQMTLWEAPGRFWGIYQRAKLPVSRSVLFITTREAGVRLSRLMRRYLSATWRKGLSAVRSLRTCQHVQWLRALVWSESGSAPPHDFIKGPLDQKSP